MHRSTWRSVKSSNLRVPDHTEGKSKTIPSPAWGTFHRTFSISFENEHKAEVGINIQSCEQEEICCVHRTCTCPFSLHSVSTRLLWWFIWRWKLSSFLPVSTLEIGTSSAWDEQYPCLASTRHSQIRLLVANITRDLLFLADKGMFCVAAANAVCGIARITSGLHNMTDYNFHKQNLNEKTLLLSSFGSAMRTHLRVAHFSESPNSQSAYVPGSHRRPGLHDFWILIRTDDFGHRVIKILSYSRQFETRDTVDTWKHLISWHLLRCRQWMLVCFSCILSSKQSDSKHQNSLSFDLMHVWSDTSLIGCFIFGYSSSTSLDAHCSTLIFFPIKTLVRLQVKHYNLDIGPSTSKVCRSNTDTIVE